MCLAPMMSTLPAAGDHVTLVSATTANTAPCGSASTLERNGNCVTERLARDLPLLLIGTDPYIAITMA